MIGSTTLLSLREAKRRSNPDRRIQIDCRTILPMARNDKRGKTFIFQQPPSGGPTLKFRRIIDIQYHAK